jgi:pimeloyl-ACP methyl ester carboxylesterase
MKKITSIVWLAVIIIFLSFGYTRPGLGAATKIEVLDRSGRPVTKITDGDSIQLRITLPEKTAQTANVEFWLDDPQVSIAACQINPGQSTCVTTPFRSLGWFWGQNGLSQPSRNIRAEATSFNEPVSTSVQVSPRPVVMVHGFISNWQAWTDYLGPAGYLASMGVSGFAVGDGQAPGVLNTGSLTDPTGRTNTIAQNAVILGKYIDEVKKLTGAQEVDLIGHSMGGMIARYYIDRVMKERDVAQLIMLGTPSSGTDCAVLPAALGFYLPTVLEIRTSYMTGIFNRQITHRHGIPFYGVAGTFIQNSLGSPCTNVPNDTVVSVQSVSDIQLPFSETPLIHTELNTSEQVFQEYVKPLLQNQPDEFQEEPDPPTAQSIPNQLPFTHVYSGHIQANGQQELTISIEPGLTVANFALFDPSQSLNVVVHGASGNEIVLDTSKNGLIKVDSPETLVQLGYGFTNPKPGAWKVLLQATDRTPSSGADFALTAHFMGGADLEGTTNTLLPRVNDPVQLTAHLKLGGQILPIEKGEALIRDSDGNQETLQLNIQDNQAEAEWKPAKPGIYGIDLQVSGKTSDGSIVERTSFLTIEAQPSQNLVRTSLLLALSGIAIVLICIFPIVLGWFLWRLYRHSHARQSLP